MTEYLIDLNGKQAAIRTGYSPKTAENQASRLLSIDKVKKEVEKRMKKRENRLQITQDDVLKAIMEDRQTARVEGQIGVAMKGNELLGKHLAMFTDKTQMSGELTVKENPMLNELREIRQSLTKGKKK